MRQYRGTLQSSRHVERCKFRAAQTPTSPRINGRRLGGLRQTAWRLVAAAGTAGGVPSIVRPAGPTARPQFLLQRILSKHDIAAIQPEASHLW